ncbi:MAG: hypothetical protein QOG63_136 [Thermoleophilaceae bacterium]|nr:hypothetical protein [Thermoleophilaceae bacterium]
MVMSGLLAASRTPARAATIEVDTTSDPAATSPITACSLRYAVIAANTNAPFGGCRAGDGHDTIALPSGNYVLTIPRSGDDSTNDPNTGDLNVTLHAAGDSLDIVGAGAATTQIDASGLGDRVMRIGTAPGVHTPAIAVRISAVSITGGHASGGTNAARPGAAGGGIENFTADLTLADSTLSDNHAGPGSAYLGIGAGPAGAGGDGGAIYTERPVTLLRSTLSGNLAGRGGDSYGYDTPGRGGAGGAIRATITGGVTVVDSAFTSNVAGAGGDSDGSIAGGGGGGGALSTAGDLDVRGSSFASNSAGSGGTSVHGVSGGPGGAIDAAGSSAIATSTFSSNAAGHGGPGATGGNGASGGAVNSSADLTVDRTSFSSNTAGPGGDVDRSSAGDPGSGGSGGAIASSGPLTVTGSALAANDGGAGGQNTFKSPVQHASSGHGAAIATTGSAAGNLTNDTVTQSPHFDAISGGGSSLALDHTTVAFNAGPGLVRSAGTVTLANSIVAINAGGLNCVGTIGDGGHNVSFPPPPLGLPACPGLVADPKLADLHDNGGPTATIALGSGSPAIDNVPAAACAAEDQRGIHRPQGPACESGAFELAAPTVAITTPADGAHYAQGSTVAAAFGCDEAGLASAIASCAGTVPAGQPIDTSSPGVKEFTATAMDKAGATASATVHYTVDAPAPPVDQPLVIASTRVTESRKGTIRVALRNPNAATEAGTLKLTARRHKHTATLGHKHFSAPPDAVVKVKLRLSGTARRYLKNHRRLHGKAAVAVPGRPALGNSRSLTIRAPR